MIASTHMYICIYVYVLCTCSCIYICIQMCLLYYPVYMEYDLLAGHLNTFMHLYMYTYAYMLIYTQSNICKFVYFNNNMYTLTKNVCKIVNIYPQFDWFTDNSVCMSIFFNMHSQQPYLYICSLFWIIDKHAISLDYAFTHTNVCALELGRVKQGWVGTHDPWQNLHCDMHFSWWNLGQ